MKTKSHIALLSIAILLMIIESSCSRVPISRRKQMNLLPESEMMALAYTEYQGFLKTHKVITGTTDAEMVNRVGNRIARAATDYLTRTKNTKRIAGYKWEYNLVEDKTVNAWCMPGGKIVVYSGLLPVTQNETALAVVIGHEVAHAVARHGNERMSQQLGIQLGGAALAVATSQKPQQTQQVFNQVYGVGSAVALALPFSRLHELEADKLGLMFMALAGYDPNEAPSFWKRMKQASSAGSQSAPPAILSTHPSDDKRIAEIQAYLPTVLKFYTKQ